MENKKDIGKAFREKLDGLQKPAPNGGWDSISSQLGQIKKPSKFPWLKTTIVSLTVVCVVVVATYFLWEKYLTQFYMVMPENNAKENTVNAPANDQPENRSANGTQTKKRPDSIKSSTPSYGNPVTSTVVIATEKKQHTDVGSSEVAESGKSQIPATDKPASVSNSEHSFSTAETNVLKAPENSAEMPTPEYRRGKLKDPTDYGADSLVINKKTEKRDFSKIADSLNRLYGKSEKMRIKFTIPPDVGVQAGSRIFYIQVIDPNNKVINEKTLEIPGNRFLAYSFTANVLYENKAVKVNEAITGKNFAKGQYRINVFDKERMITSTTFTFK
ncbi:hypothetical protein AAEO56_04480 [Flavobacterium sp. DGU11]|uniref:Uncharacterized protein n=1 Tax=Flavobacterium arundinis TaxID=3139143 RepID=A0ABU9HTS7_9FLAO